MWYHLRSAVPKAAVPKTSMSRPIIEFYTMDSFFYWSTHGHFGNGLLEAAFVARYDDKYNLGLELVTMCTCIVFKLSDILLLFTNLFCMYMYSTPYTLQSQK